VTLLMGANKASPPSIKYMLLAAVASSDIPSEICSFSFRHTYL
jgi:hypothetical protein